MKPLSILLFITLLFVGCVTTKPSIPYHNDVYQAAPLAFTIKGSTVGYSESKKLLPLFMGDGIFFWGNGGFQQAYYNAMENAKELGGNDLINVYSDVEHYNVLYLYSEERTIVYGTVVKNKLQDTTLVKWDAASELSYQKYLEYQREQDSIRIQRRREHYR